MDNLFNFILYIIFNPFTWGITCIFASMHVFFLFVMWKRLKHIDSTLALLLTRENNRAFK